MLSRQQPYSFRGLAMFVDIAKVIIKSGAGGNGCVSFRREKYKPRGGPDGGDGGNGGDVLFVGDQGMNSLAPFRFSPRLFANSGRPGTGNTRSGKRGQDKLVRVPCGTILRHAETGEILGEITQPGQHFTVAQGGKGGRGNQHFATAVHQAPRFCEEGRPGVAINAVLELKVMADVGLVGLPNAGKSSLITAVSNARPKIAGYPFTTRKPEVGVIDLPGYRTIVMADIPGIIEGASGGRGLGIQFLKHVERTRVLLFVVDVSPFADIPPDKALEILRQEIHAFGQGLEEKRFLIAANKTDLDPDRTDLQAFAAQLDRQSAAVLFPVSALTRAGLNELIAALDRMVHGT